MKTCLEQWRNRLAANVDWHRNQCVKDSWIVVFDVDIGIS
jgi:hypothetical protein